jgi:hypothetical protein
MKQWIVVVALVIAALCVPSLARAQTVAINPQTVEFTASADHAALSLDGSPMVTRYEIRMYVEATPLGSAIATQDLGKPTPDGTNKISVTNPVWFAGLTPRTRYVAKVAAIGNSGEGLSTISNPFGNVPAPASPTAVVLKR